jgi:quercetin dioxygenase-like cupin family protein
MIRDTKTLDLAKRELLDTITRITLEYSVEGDSQYANVPTPLEVVDIIDVRDVFVGATLTELNDTVSSVSCALNYFTDDITILNVVFKEGGNLPLHRHSDRWEYIYVMHGEIYDMVSKKSTREGYVYKIPPNTPHHIVSEAGALLTVTFRPKYPTTYNQ